MSGWNHCLCHDCWVELRGDRVPVRVTGVPDEGCCRCGKPTNSGIYIRDTPMKFEHCETARVHVEED